MIFLKPRIAPHSIINEYFHVSLGTILSLEGISVLFASLAITKYDMLLRNLSSNPIQNRRGPLKITPKRPDQGSLKTLVTKWRGYEKNS